MGYPARRPELISEGSIRGVVVHGRRLGRELGYPTANVLLGEGAGFAFGVYATRCRLADGRRLHGVANIGCNPTTGVVSPRLEVFLFDFDEEIYGEVLETELVEFIRPELIFAGIPALIAQIRRDVEIAKVILGLNVLAPEKVREPPLRSGYSLVAID
ncbi:MAG TPA: riboflavin kinase [Caulobacteraceae bacterium]|jgi:riboflavin kinase/FMN adenylyltransferase